MRKCMLDEKQKEETEYISFFFLWTKNCYVTTNIFVNCFAITRNSCWQIKVKRQSAWSWDGDLTEDHLTWMHEIIIFFPVRTSWATGFSSFAQTQDFSSALGIFLWSLKVKRNHFFSFPKAWLNEFDDMIESS